MSADPMDTLNTVLGNGDGEAALAALNAFCDCYAVGKPMDLTACDMADATEKATS